MTAAAADERASLPKEYTYHSPGSVQETDDKVVFAHQTPEEASKWEKSTVFHVGDDSEAPVRVGVVIGEFHNKLMDRMLEDARIAAVSMVSGGEKGDETSRWLFLFIYFFSAKHCVPPTPTRGPKAR